jgi:hypothetical protein
LGKRGTAPVRQLSVKLVQPFADGATRMQAEVLAYEGLYERRPCARILRSLSIGPNTEQGGGKQRRARDSIA